VVRMYLHAKSLLMKPVAGRMMPSIDAVPPRRPARGPNCPRASTAPFAWSPGPWPSCTTTS